MVIGRRCGHNVVEVLPKRIAITHDMAADHQDGIANPRPRRSADGAGPLASLLVIERIDESHLTVGAWPRSGDLFLGEEANLRIGHITTMLPFFHPLRADV